MGWRRRESNGVANPPCSLANPKTPRVRGPKMYPKWPTLRAGETAPRPLARLRGGHSLFQFLRAQREG